MPYIAESLTAVLINTLVALTIDRYIAIVHPFTHISNRWPKILKTAVKNLVFILQAVQDDDNVDLGFRFSI